MHPTPGWLVCLSGTRLGAGLKVEPGATIMETSDAELVARCRAARQTGGEAFALLYRRHGGAVLAFLRGMLPGDEGAARDALQETFLRLHGALPELDGERPLRPWLFRVARNLSLDALKRAGAREVPHEPAALGALGVRDPAPEPDEAAGRRELATLLRRAAQALPVEEREVFLLRHERGLTFEEVAAAVGCSLRTAKYRMKAALEALGREAERLGVQA